MIVEAGKLKPRQKPLDAEPAAPAEPRAAPEKPVAAKPAARPAPQTGTLRDMSLPDVVPVDVAGTAPTETVLLERREAPPQRSDDADDYFGAPPPPRGAAPVRGTQP
ncbi:MAG TPA: hypothetical protein PL196_04455, partial [Burkholderiaceae bacterium]|nr:hypothetical protein [Burkholderiaceae bacterium]